MIRSYRQRGHLIAKLDPLGMMKSDYLDELHPESYGFKKEDYDKGNGWGHVCIETPDVYKACEDLEKLGVNITRKPGPMKHGTRVIAFCEDPDGYKVELNEPIKV